MKNLSQKNKNSNQNSSKNSSKKSLSQQDDTSEQAQEFNSGFASAAQKLHEHETENDLNQFTNFGQNESNSNSSEDYQAEISSLEYAQYENQKANNEDDTEYKNTS